MIKWLIHQEGNMIINVYMPNNLGPKQYIWARINGTKRGNKQIHKHNGKLTYLSTEQIKNQ